MSDICVYLGYMRKISSKITKKWYLSLEIMRRLVGSAIRHATSLIIDAGCFIHGTGVSSDHRAII